VPSAAPGAPHAVSAEYGLLADTPPLSALRRLVSMIITLCRLEIRKIRRDRTELYTRAIQPALWLLIFGETFTGSTRGFPTWTTSRPASWPTRPCPSQSSMASRSSGSAMRECSPR
jgi:ABC-2 type transport system permease protein